MPAYRAFEGVNANPIALYAPDAGPGRPSPVPFDPTGALPNARIPGNLMQRASVSRDDVTAIGKYAPAPAPQPVAAVAPPAVPVETVQLPMKKGAAFASLSFDCPDDSRFIRAALAEGAQAWCETDGGEKHGRFVRLFSSGRKAEEGEFQRGKKHGRWIDDYEQGGERSRVEWRKGVQSW